MDIQGCSFIGNTYYTTAIASVALNIAAIQSLASVKNCIFRDNVGTGDGVALATAFPATTAYNCVFANNGGTSAVYLNSNNSKIYNSTFAKNNGIGLRFGAATTGNEAKNNIFWSNTDNTITGGTSPTKDYNAYSGATGADAGSYSITSLTVSPNNTFVNPTTTYTGPDYTNKKAESDGADWSLKAGSPAINAGADLAPIVTTDILGNTRPTEENKVDIGAYEIITFSEYANGSNINITSHLNVNSPKTFGTITIAPGGKLTNSSDLIATSITLKSDATGTATMLNSGTYTGSFTAEQYLGSARNWYVSSPVVTTNSPANSIARYYEYVEAGDNADLAVTGSTAYWKGLNTGTAMTRAKGYIAQATTSTTVQFTGTPNDGDIITNFNLTRDDAKGKGFNLVGNPYPSYLDWSLVAEANTNLTSTAWFKTKKTSAVGGGYTFASVNVEDPVNIEIVSNNANTTITKYIPPTQAFWVRVKSGTSSTTMNFTNAMREHRLSTSDLMKAPRVNERSRLRLQLENGFETDETLIYFDSKATNDFNEYDSPKMMNNSSLTPDLYSKAGSERLVINGLGEMYDNMELPLGFSLNAAATLKLRATEMSNFSNGTLIYLLDKLDNKELELQPNIEYSFSTTEATTNNESRFSLIFRAPKVTTGIDNAVKLNAQLFVNEANQITIISSEKVNYSIYNGMGQLVENGIVNTKHETQNSKFDAGVYFVAITINGESEIRKVIIR